MGTLRCLIEKPETLSDKRAEGGAARRPRSFNLFNTRFQSTPALNVAGSVTQLSRKRDECSAASSASLSPGGIPTLKEVEKKEV